MYYPEPHDEITGIVNYLRMELDALRDATHGLDDEAARSRPLRSTLTLSGLLKHACYVMAGALSHTGEPLPDSLDLHDFYGSFALTEGETLEGIRAMFDELKDRYLEMCAGTDPDQDFEAAPMPWIGVEDMRPIKMRYLLVHHIEEFARHAGHADIIREQIDGALAMELNAAVEGRPANEFITPWSPERGEH